MREDVGPFSTPSTPVRTTMTSEHCLEEVRRVIGMEAGALVRLRDSVGQPFADALNLIASCRGKVVITGVGKSGLIARKIASTMSSTGTQATFIHPSDGIHGDLGILREGDVVIAIGKSGESEELLRLLPSLKRLGTRLIAITSRPDSSLARSSDIVLHAPVEKEACPHDLAPTVSTTVALAVGDALAITLMRMRGFQSENFALYHPGGSLGKRLWLKVRDLMIPVEKCAVQATEHATLESVILGLSEFGHGIVLFCNPARNLEGILTDGDIRRLLSEHREKIFKLDVRQVMNPTPWTLDADCKAVDALRFMEDRARPLNVAPIVKEGCLLGVLRLHELVGLG